MKIKTAFRKKSESKINAKRPGSAVALLTILVTLQVFGAATLAHAQSIHFKGKSIHCPLPSGDETNEADIQAVVNYVLAQRNCSDASAVFEECKIGNVFDLVDQTEAMVGICEKVIAKDAKIRTIYSHAIKSCELAERAGREREQIAFENECSRRLASAFAWVIEAKKHAPRVAVIH
jgi:hypothetical protein